jgi:hypothetical protein
VNIKGDKGGSCVLVYLSSFSCIFQICSLLQVPIFIYAPITISRGPDGFVLVDESRSIRFCFAPVSFVGETLIQRPSHKAISIYC